MFNISPIGRNCSREERNDYEKFDLEHNIRKNMVAAMQKEFADLGLTYSIGGQISFDVFPTGWDKTYCLKFLPEGGTYSTLGLRSTAPPVARQPWTILTFRILYFLSLLDFDEVHFFGGTFFVDW